MATPCDATRVQRRGRRCRAGPAGPRGIRWPACCRYCHCYPRPRWRQGSTGRGSDWRPNSGSNSGLVLPHRWCRASDSCWTASCWARLTGPGWAWSSFARSDSRCCCCSGWSYCWDCSDPATSCSRSHCLASSGSSAPYSALWSCSASWWTANCCSESCCRVWPKCCPAWPHSDWMTKARSNWGSTGWSNSGSTGLTHPAKSWPVTSLVTWRYRASSWRATSWPGWKWSNSGPGCSWRWTGCRSSCCPAYPRSVQLPTRHRPKAPRSKLTVVFASWFVYLSVWIAAAVAVLKQTSEAPVTAGLAHAMPGAELKATQNGARCNERRWAVQGGTAQLGLTRASSLESFTRSPKVH